MWRPTAASCTPTLTGSRSAAAGQLPDQASLDQLMAGLAGQPGIPEADREALINRCLSADRFSIPVTFRFRYVSAYARVADEGGVVRRLDRSHPHS